MRKHFEEQAAKLGLVGTAALAYVENALAAVPTAVTTAVETAGADMVTIATAVFVAIIGLLAFSLMRRAAH